MRKRASILVSVGLLLGLVGCDHATKGTARAALADRPPVTLIAGVADLRYAENRGVAFNLERLVPGGLGRAVLIGAGLLGFGVIVLAWARRKDRMSAATIGYVFVAAGALGNLIDRIARGYVIDFIHVNGWPVFNVADVSIGVGVGLLLLAMIRERRRPAGPTGPTAPAAS
jgi:signal peptidase II